MRHPNIEPPFVASFPEMIQKLVLWRCRGFACVGSALPLLQFDQLFPQTADPYEEHLSYEFSRSKTTEVLLRYCFESLILVVSRAIFLGA